jgi:acyl dehydratase
LAPLGKPAEDVLPIEVIEVRADKAEAAEFAAALGLRVAPDSVPLTFPIRWLASPALRKAVQQSIGSSCLVHASQSFLYDTPLTPGRNYQLRIVIRGNASSRRSVVHGTVYDESDRVVLTLESALHAADDLSTMIRPTKQRSGDGSLPEIDLGPVDAQQTARYLATARDDNPLHFDPKIARSVGLDGPILPGMMMMGLFERALSEWRKTGRVARLFALFVRPAPVGGRLAIGGNLVLHPNREEKERQIVRLIVRREQGPIVCIGEASIGSEPSARLPAENDRVSDCMKP